MIEEFWSWWQHLPQNIDPIIFGIGSFKLQYYGLMYIVAFAITFFLVLYRVKHEDRFEITPDQIKDLSTYMVLGLASSFFFFLTGLRQTHNAYHYAVGIPRVACEWLMFVLSVLMLGSMHAVQINHLHHRRKPDPECGGEVFRVHSIPRRLY